MVRIRQIAPHDWPQRPPLVKRRYFDAVGDLWRVVEASASGVSFFATPARLSFSRLAQKNPEICWFRSVPARAIH